MDFALASQETMYSAECLERFCNTFLYDIHGFGLKTLKRTDAFHHFIPESYCLLYLVTGHVDIQSGKTAGHFGSGDLLLLEPFEHYLLSSQDSAGVSFYRLSFDVGPAIYLGAFRDMAMVRNTSLKLPAKAEEFGQRCADIWYNPAAVYSEALYQLLSDILRALFSVTIFEGPLPSMQPTAERALAKQSLDYIGANLRLPIRVADISACFGVSESYLYKAFMNSIGIAPGRFIQREKARAAARLLCIERATVGHTSSLMGYTSTFQFSKSFKCVFGASPRAYVREVSNHERLM